MIYSPRKQQGLTMTSILMVVIFICGVALLLLKIVPIYMNHGKVQSAIESITTISEVELKSKSQIKALLSKRFRVNSVNSLPKDAVKVFKRGNYVKIVAKYQIVEPLFSNLSVLVEFDEFVEAGRK
ncbi:MAG: DUF4845 domain-containing protein [Methylococcales bacterium]|nr:DUF4845 domain-containing protein [Methylococcales bacterium]